MKRIFFLFLFLLFSAGSYAAEQATVCAKYQTQYGWSQGYKVQANIVKGTELNQATHSFNYSPLSTYVVIFWGPGEASVIQMGFPLLTVVGQQGVDQQGRNWEVSKSNFCF